MSEEKRLQDLFTAVEVGNVEQVKSILKRDEFLVDSLIRNRPLLRDSGTYDKNSLLKLAISQNNAEMVNFLLNHQAFSRSQNFRIKLRKLLHMALKKNLKPVVQILINHARLTDICSCDYYPDPEFAEEIFNQSLKMFVGEECLDAESIVHIEHALERAVSHGRTYQVKRLIETAANVNAKYRGSSLLHTAAKQRHVSVFEYLVTKMTDLDAVDHCGCTPLHYVSKVQKGYHAFSEKYFEDSLKIMKILLQNGASVRIYDEDGNTPLHYAVEEKEFRPEKIRLLLDYKANVNVKRGRRGSPIFFARCPAIVQMLIERGANVNAVNFHKRTPLHEASKITCGQEKFEESLKIMKILLQNGASVRVFDKDGNTPLHYAVQEKEFRPEKIRLLLDYEADVNAERDGGGTPIFFATCPAIVQMLIERGANVNAVNYSGRTPLHHASEITFCQKEFEESLAIMQILLKHGASVHVFDHWYRTPLHYAVAEKIFRPEKIRLLLDYKADVNAHQGRKPVPIFFAECEATVQMLIDKGADVNYTISNGNCESPLHSAIRKNNYTKVEILLENGAKIHNFSSGRKELGTEGFETIVDGMPDVSVVIEMLVKYPRKYENLISILVKRHFLGEITINSQEFLSASFLEFSMFKECQEELERMRDVHVLSFNLLDILTMPIQKLRRYVTQNEVLNFFHSSFILYNKFNKYSGMMMKRFRKAKEERNLIDSSSEVLKKFVFRSHEIHLPDLVVYKIMGMLHMVDLKKLVEL